MRLIAFILLPLMLAACGGGNAPQAITEPHAVHPAAPVTYGSEKGAYAVTELVAGLEHPWALAFLPQGGMLVTERPGRLRRIGADGRVSAPITGLPAIFVDGQAGLLDVALSPGFARDQVLFLSFAEPNLRGNKAGTAVLRARLQDDALMETKVIYRQEPKMSHGTHVGSRLAFDGAGHLFVTQGDNRVAAAAAQELDKLPGKLVRIWPDGRIPEDNPYVGRDDARAEIWSYGHRNMQGAAINPADGRLWTSEHGPMGGDEINLPQPGKNYGWPVITDGKDYSGGVVPGSVGKSSPGMERPHHVWAVSPGLSGMAFYSGDLFPQWKGNLFLGALASSNLIRLELEGERVVHEERLLVERQQRIRDVRQGPDGALYVLVDAVDGRLLKITPVP